MNFTNVIAIPSTTKEATQNTPMGSIRRIFGFIVLHPTILCRMLQCVYACYVVTHQFKIQLLGASTKKGAKNHVK